jgi:hypothetical protein
MLGNAARLVNRIAHIVNYSVNTVLGVLECARCGSASYTAANAAVVFRVCQQDSARRRRTAHPVCVAPVAFE